MTWIQMLPWWLMATAGLLGSAVFSGLETGIYTLNRVRLHVLAHVPHSSAHVLEQLVHRPNRLLGTLLVGNNLANYAATLGIGAILQSLGYSAWAQVAINTALLTPLLLIFGEILPKDFFRSHADRITPPFARPLLFMQWLLTATGILPLIDLISHTLQRVLGSRHLPSSITHPRRVVSQLMREGAGHGAISPYQSDMVERVLQIGKLKVADVMVPWSKAATLRVNQPVEAAWSLADRLPYARLPLVDLNHQPIGIIDLNALLTYEPDACPPLTELARPVVYLSPGMHLGDALRRLQEQTSSMGLVRQHGRTLGLVTVKDLVEPIVGELYIW